MKEKSSTVFRDSFFKEVRYKLISKIWEELILSSTGEKYFLGKENSMDESPEVSKAINFSLLWH